MQLIMRTVCRALVIAVVLGVPGVALVVPAASASPAYSPVPRGWTMFGHDALHSGVSPTASIGAAEVGELHQVWTSSIGRAGTEQFYASPVVVYDASLDEEVAYLVRTSREVEALVVTGDETPRVLWRTSVNAPVYSTPAVYDNTLYFGNQDGTLTALNATTGVLECSMRLPIVQPETVPGHIYSSPVVGQVDDTGPIVYFGDSGQHEWLNGGHEWAMTGVGNTAGGCQQRWVFDAFANRGTAGDRTGSWSEPALVKDRVGTWLLVFGTSNPDDSIYALDAATGAEVWQYQTAIVGSDDDVGAGPTISAPWVNGFSDGVVYDLGKDGIEVALDLGTGQPIWTYSFVANAGGVMDAPSVADLVGDTLYEDYHGYVYSLNATTGALNWRTTTPMGYTVASPSISGAPGDQVLFIGDTTGVVNGYRLSDGALVWSTDLGGKVLSSPAISDGLLLLGSTNTVYGFRPVVPPPTHERH